MTDEEARMRAAYEEVNAAAARGDREAIDRLSTIISDDAAVKELGERARLSRRCAVEALELGEAHLQRRDFTALVAALRHDETREIAARLLEHGAVAGKTSAMMALRLAVQHVDVVGEAAAQVLAFARQRLERADLRALARLGLRAEGETRARDLLAEGVQRGDDNVLDALRALLRERPRGEDPGLERAKQSAIMLLANNPALLEPEDLDRLCDNANSSSPAQRNRLLDAIGGAMNAAVPVEGADKRFIEMIQTAETTGERRGLHGLRAVARKHVLTYFAQEGGNARVLAALAPRAIGWADDDAVAERAAGLLRPRALKGDVEALTALAASCASTARHYPVMASLLAGELLVEAGTKGQAAAVCEALLPLVSGTTRRDDRAAYVVIGRTAARLPQGDALRGEILALLQEKLVKIDARRASGAESVLCGLLALSADLEQRAHDLLQRAFAQAVDAQAAPGLILDLQVRLALRRELLGVLRPELAAPGGVPPTRVRPAARPGVAADPPQRPIPGPTSTGASSTGASSTLRGAGSTLRGARSALRSARAPAPAAWPRRPAVSSGGTADKSTGDQAERVSPTPKKKKKKKRKKTGR